MRILHTSDWHLGRTFFGVDQHTAQTRFLDFLLATVEAERIDAVLVAGDVYDRAIPDPDSLELFDTTAARLRTLGTRLVISSGNHDSFMRLGMGRTHLDAVGLHIRTRLSDITWPVPLPTAQAPAAVVYAIPYLEPGLVHTRFGVARTHTAVLTFAMDRIVEHAAAHFPGLPLIVMAHAFVGGAVGSESERDIGIGGVGIAPATVFEGASYAALGHLHRPQDVTATVRYSGSPIPYSFGEAEAAKRMYLLETTDTGLQVSAVPVPAFTRIATLRGTFEQVLATAADHTDALVAVELTDEQRVEDALGRLRAVLPKLVKLSYPDSPVPGALHTRDAAALSPRTDTEVFTSFIAEITGSPAAAAQTGRFEAALTAARREDA